MGAEGSPSAHPARNKVCNVTTHLALGCPVDLAISLRVTVSNLKTQHHADAQPEQKQQLYSAHEPHRILLVVLHGNIRLVREGLSCDHGLELRTASVQTYEGALCTAEHRARKP